MESPEDFVKTSLLSRSNNIFASLLNQLQLWISGETNTTQVCIAKFWTLLLLPSWNTETSRDIFKEDQSKKSESYAIYNTQTTNLVNLAFALQVSFFHGGEVLERKDKISLDKWGGIAHVFLSNNHEKQF